MNKLECRVDDVIRQYVPENTTAVSCLAAKDGKVFFRKAYGLADIENGIPAKPEDNFIIASNTKQFTCLAILMLRDRGLLALDETIERFFPDFPEYRKTVTIRQLMTHTSGIPEYFEHGFAENIELYRTADTADLLEIAKSLGYKTDFDPGSEFSYCNTAYVMLGDIVRQLTGKKFGEFLETEIFAPLGMDRSFAPDYMDQKDPYQVEGYAKNSETGELEKVPYDMLEIGYADGNISSNVDDLLRWHAFLYGDDKDFGSGIIDKEHLKELYTPSLLSDGSESCYGMGIFLKGADEIHRKAFPDKEERWHSGGTMGFITRASYFPEDKVSLILLTNWHDVDLDGIFRAYATAVFDGLEQK